MVRWRSLLLILLLGGLAEASWGQASLGQSASEIVVDPALSASVDPSPSIQEAAAPDVTSEAPPVVLPTAETGGSESIQPVIVPDSDTNPRDNVLSPETTLPTVEAPPSLNLPEAPAAEAATPTPGQTAKPETAQTEDDSTAETVEVDVPSASLETTTDTAPSSTAPTPSTEIQGTEAATAKRVYLAEKQISFVPPRGFTAMSPAEIQAKFPQAMPPAYAYANEARDVSVGITVSDIPLDPSQLPEVKMVLEEFLESSVPGFQWLENDFVNLSGQDWIKLEFISQTPEQRIHNDMYITSLQGKLLGFNFNANLESDATLRPLLRASRNSISLDPIVGGN